MCEVLKYLAKCIFHMSKSLFTGILIKVAMLYHPLGRIFQQKYFDIHFSLSLIVVLC